MGGQNGGRPKETEDGPDNADPDRLNTYIFVLEMPQQLQLPIRPLSQYLVVERLDNLLDRDGLAGDCIGGRADETKGAHPDRLEVDIPVRDVELGAEEGVGGQVVVGLVRRLQLVRLAEGELIGWCGTCRRLRVGGPVGGHAVAEAKVVVDG